MFWKMVRDCFHLNRSYTVDISSLQEFLNNSLFKIILKIFYIKPEILMILIFLLKCFGGKFNYLWQYLFIKVS